MGRETADSLSQLLGNSNCKLYVTWLMTVSTGCQGNHVTVTLNVNDFAVMQKS